MKKTTKFNILILIWIYFLLTSCGVQKETNSIHKKKIRNTEITNNKTISNPYNPVGKMDLLKHKNGDSITKMHFLVFGDSKGTKYFKDVLRADLLQPDFCITTADLVNKGGGKSGEIDYKQLDEDGGWFMRKYPMWPTVGNHEESGGDDALENFSNFYGMKKAMYSFEYGNAKFIALPWPKIKDNSKKLAWLENELKTANGKHIFIFKHRPHYDVGAKSYEDVEGEETATTKLYDKYKVTAVFSGHDHLYYRTKRNHTNYIISSGAGASIYPLKRESDAIKGDVYYGRRIRSEIKLGAVPYKFVNSKGNITDIPKAIYYVLSVKIDGEKITIKMIESLTGKIWDSATIDNK